MKATLPIFIIATLIFLSCSQTKSDQEANAQQETTTEMSLSEIEQAIKKEEWEKARIKAENLYANQRQKMGAIESIKLAIAYTAS